MRLWWKGRILRGFRFCVARCLSWRGLLRAAGLLHRAEPERFAPRLECRWHRESCQTPLVPAALLLREKSGHPGPWLLLLLAGSGRLARCAPAGVNAARPNCANSRNQLARLPLATLG